MKNEVWKQWAKDNWFWVLVYGSVLVYFVARYCWQSSDPDLDQWSHFKQAIALPLVIFLAAVFVNLFSNPIILPPKEGEVSEKVKNNMSLQRRNWMIFAYGFMLFALLVPIYMFGPGWDGMKKTDSDRSDVLHPLAVFVGCSLDDPKGDSKKELSCFFPAENKIKVDASKPDAQQSANPAAKQLANPVAKQPAQPDSQHPAESVTVANIAGGAWVINLGGHVINALACKASGDSGVVCQVRGGLLVPLYVIILALMGGSISLTRRLPEYQKCANPEYVSTEKEPKISQHEFREYLIFQMVQFVSAPLIAILAYFLVDPSNPSASVALAFTAGFASESILLMVRAAAEKVSPTSAAPATGTISGVVTLASAGGQPAKNAVVSLANGSQVRGVTDDSGFYVLNNVPVGEHGVKVAMTDYEPVTGSVKIERAQEIVRQHWVLKAKA